MTIEYDEGKRYEHTATSHLYATRWCTVDKSAALFFSRDDLWLCLFYTFPLQQAVSDDNLSAPSILHGWTEREKEIVKGARGERLVAQ